MACLARTRIFSSFLLLLLLDSARSLRLGDERDEASLEGWTLLRSALDVARGSLAFGVASIATYPLRNLNLALRQDGHLESLRTTAVELLDKRGRPVREKNGVKKVRVPLPLAQVLPRLMEGSVSNSVPSAVGFGLCMALHPILVQLLPLPTSKPKHEVVWGHVERVLPLVLLSAVTNTVSQVSRLMLRGSRGAGRPIQDMVFSVVEQVPILDLWVMRDSLEEQRTSLAYLLLLTGIGALTTPGEVKRHTSDVASLSWLRREEAKVAVPRPSPPLFNGLLLTAARFVLRGFLAVGSLALMDAMARPASSLSTIMSSRRRRRTGGVREGGRVTLAEAMNYQVNDEEIVIFDVPVDPEVGVDLVDEVVEPIGKKRSSRKRRRS